MASQWYWLGLAMKVPKTFLDKLKEYPENQCLVEVLDYWLRNHPDKPTWQEIADAQKKVKGDKWTSRQGASIILLIIIMLACIEHI